MDDFTHRICRSGSLVCVQLPLTLVAHGGARDVLLEVPPGTRLADVGLEPAEALPCVGGVVLRPDAVLGQPPLLRGAALSRDRPSEVDLGPSGALLVRVESGPEAGGLHQLRPGRHTIGRALGAQIRIDDPDVSRVHAELTVDWSGATIRDLGSTNGTSVDGVGVGSDAMQFTFGSRLRVGSSTLTITAPHHASASLQADGEGGLRVNRPPRLEPPLVLPEVALPAEPAEPEPLRFPVLATLLPLGAAGVFALIAGPMFLAFVLLSPVMMAAQWLTDRARRRRSAGAAQERYDAAQAEATAAIDDAVRREAAWRAATHPDPAELLLIARAPTPQLWTRRPGDVDFLDVRVGTGRLRAGVTVRTPAGVPPRTEPPVLDDAPIAIPLAVAGVLGVAGPRDMVVGVARSVVGQLAVMHSPRDLSIVVLAPGDRSVDWAWLRWLPHVAPSDGQDCRALLGFDDAQVAARVDELGALLDARHAAAGPTTAPWSGPRTVVVLDGAEELRSTPAVARLLADGPRFGIYAVCLAGAAESLPHECGARAMVHGEVGTLLTVEIADTEPIHATVDAVSSSWAERVARALAALSDATPDQGGATLPSSVRLLDLLCGDLDPESVVAQWATAADAPRATLGVGSGGPVEIDLRRDGPHAVVAGTTGSGKSELLQTLVASLALGSRPDQMSFVLVDYKGGAAFGECARLPHTVGLVTDLDDHLTRRALASLTAELERRERALAAASCASLDDAIRVGRARDLPRLVIVVDEFATLVEELPDFVRGLVGVAMRGRSLGVHLVLATQRPAGAVSADIRANIGLRIALRMADAADSVDVLDVRDAAALPRRTPGRALARRAGEALEPFQAARVTGSAALASGPRVLDWHWQRLGDPLPPEGAEAPDAQSDLARILEVTTAAAARLGTEPARSPWLPPLPAQISHDELIAAVREHRPTFLPFGVADRPREQSREVVGLDLDRGGHLLVVGTPRSGRTTALRAVAASIAARTTTSDVHLHVIDGGGSLRSIDALPHCGAVVSSDQVDRIDRLLTRLRDEVRRRSALLARQGIPDLAAQRDVAAHGEQLPYLVLMIDRWESLTEALDDLDGGRLTDAVVDLVRSGAAVGVRVVVAGDRSVLTGRLATLVPDKLVLRLADRGDFALAGLAARELPDEMPPGRAVQVGTAAEVQVGWAASVPPVEAVAPGAPLPFRVDALPERVGYDPALLAPEAAARLWVPVGMGGDELGPIGVDLSADGSAMVVCGPPRTGRSTTLVTIARSLLDRGERVVLVAPRASPLRRLSARPGVLGMITTATAMDDLHSLLADMPDPLTVLVDDVELLTDTPVGQALEWYAKQIRDAERGLVVAGTTSELLSAFRGVAVEARKHRLGVLLCPESTVDGDVLNARLPRSVVGARIPGRGVLVRHGALTAVQVPIAA